MINQTNLPFMGLSGGQPISTSADIKNIIDNDANDSNVNEAKTDLEKKEQESEKSFEPLFNSYVPTISKPTMPQGLINQKHLPFMGLSGDVRLKTISEMNEANTDLQELGMESEYLDSSFNSNLLAVPIPTVSMPSFSMPAVPMPSIPTDFTVSMSLQDRKDTLALIEKLVEEADENLAQEALAAKKALAAMAKLDDEQFLDRLEDENAIPIPKKTRRDDGFYARLNNWIVKFTAKNSKYGWKSWIAGCIFVVGFKRYVIGKSQTKPNLMEPSFSTRSEVSTATSTINGDAKNLTGPSDATSQICYEKLRKLVQKNHKAIEKNTDAGDHPPNVGQLCLEKLPDKTFVTFMTEGIIADACTAANMGTDTGGGNSQTDTLAEQLETIYFYYKNIKEFVGGPVTEEEAETIDKDETIQAYKDAYQADVCKGVFDKAEKNRKIHKFKF